MKSRAAVLVAVAAFALVACQSSPPATTYDLAETILMADAGEYAPSRAGDDAADAPWPMLVAADPAAVKGEAPADAPKPPPGDVPPGTEDQQGWNKWHRAAIMASLELIANFNTEVRVDSDIGGTTINLEDLLGLSDSSAIFRLDAYYRFNRRHRLDLSWFFIPRDASQTIDEEIEIPPDDKFPVGAKVSTELNTNIVKLFYTWFFLPEDDWELGVQLGLYWMSLKAKLKAEVELGSADPIEGDGEETLKAELPLPLIGLRFNWAFAERFRLSAWFQFLYLSIDAYKGGIFDGWLGVEWDTWDWGGFGLSYNYFNLGAEAKNEDFFNFTGKLDYQYHALLASFYVYW